MAVVAVVVLLLLAADTAFQPTYQVLKYVAGPMSATLHNSAFVGKATCSRNGKRHTGVVLKHAALPPVPRVLPRHRFKHDMECEQFFMVGAAVDEFLAETKLVGNGCQTL